MNSIKWILLVSLIICSCSDKSGLTKVPIGSNWEFTQEGKSDWREADVPGVVQSDLISHKLIAHPWEGTNELNVQWVENENWLYRTTFDIEDDDLVNDAIDLVFDGLDTYADVTLNGQPILSANNMFRSWRIDVKSLLRKGKNSLSIKFKSPIHENGARLDSLGYVLPAPNETVERKVSPFTRKAPYHFGWDWGLRLVTAGIWRPVYLEMYNDVRIEDVQIVQLSLDEALAKLNAVVTIKSLAKQKIELDVLGEKSEHEVNEGANGVVIPFEITNPKRWWPNGWGEQHLYEIPVAVSLKGSRRDEKMIKTGLRTVELVQERDSIGESFYFKINGKPLFARGANYIPQSHFLASVSDEDYKQLIADASNANMNMLRVWGGGIYENDVFYELCDEYGILVWQDFMFACSMYPGDSAFIENVENEVIENVKRLRNHPSIVHWNGNNEVDVAWNNWGWQNQFEYAEADSIQIWSDYLKLFHERIPTVLGKLDNRPYSSTSPLSNWGKPENFNFASMHYWGVWHGPDDFDGYQKYVGRFMSEYGFQSFPNMETIAQFADSSEWRLNSEVMKHHQKSYVGNGMIAKQTANYFEEPTDFEDFVLKSQMTQAKAMQIAIDAHRLKKGHCWGTLFWQLNDCWPGPSWSAIDVYGRKKVFYEELDDLYAPIALIPQVMNDSLIVTLVNDSLGDFEGLMKIDFTLENAENKSLSQLVWSKANGIEEMLVVKLPEGFIEGQVELVRGNEVIHHRKF